MTSTVSFFDHSLLVQCVRTPSTKARRVWCFRRQVCALSVRFAHGPHHGLARRPRRVPSESSVDRTIVDVSRSHGSPGQPSKPDCGRGYLFGTDTRTRTPGSMQSFRTKREKASCRNPVGAVGRLSPIAHLRREYLRSAAAFVRPKSVSPSRESHPLAVRPKTTQTAFPQRKLTVQNH